MEHTVKTVFCVSGDGISGFCAALAAARHGVNTVFLTDALSFDGQTEGSGIAAEIALAARCKAVSHKEIMAEMADREENLTLLPKGTEVRADLYADCAFPGEPVPDAFRIGEKDAPGDMAAWGGVYEDGAVFGVGFRYLLSEKADDRLSAGGGAALGQAAGTAAAIAVKHGITPKEVLAHHLEELQETLQYDDCFLPYCRRDVSEAALTASLECDDALSGDILNLRTGIDRCHPLYGEGDQGFTMAPGASIEYHMDMPVEVIRTRIVFDAEGDTGGMPPALAKVYALEIETENGWEGILFENENTRRVITAAVCRPLTGIRLTVMETWGADGVHLLSFDFE